MKWTPLLTQTATDLHSSVAYAVKLPSFVLFWSFSKRTVYASSKTYEIISFL